MRYARADRLIQLALEMQAARGGLTLTDIEQRFGVSRRTAIRMRDAVVAAFPQADQVPSNDRSKRWRLSGGATRPLLGITADDLASLENAAALLARENLAEQADELRGVASKIRATLAAELMRKIDPDLGALAEAEGLAMRPGPRPAIPASLFAQLRNAIKSCRIVSFSYASRTSGKDEERIVRPLGFLYGHRHYLVALPDAADPPEGRGAAPLLQPAADQQVAAAARKASSAIRPSPCAPSSPRRSASTRKRPSMSSGASAPKPPPSPGSSSSTPTQTSETQPDGALIVRFHAGGLLEMAWHLMTWGRHVEVLAPQALKDMLPAEMPDWPALP